MTITVETGTGSSTAESYITVAEFASYHALRGNTLAATLSDAEIEQALRRATDYMIQKYRMLWKGTKNTSTQALDWPRSYVYLEPVVTGANSDDPTLVANDIVPVEVKNALAQMAFKGASGDLFEDIEQQATTETIGPITVQYNTNSQQSLKKRYAAIDAMLSPYLNVNSSSAIMGLVRS